MEVALGGAARFTAEVEDFVAAAFVAAPTVVATDTWQDAMVQAVWAHAQVALGRRTLDLHGEREEIR